VAAVPRDSRQSDPTKNNEKKWLKKSCFAIDDDDDDVSHKF
jgi:hypothetical protein